MYDIFNQIKATYQIYAIIIRPVATGGGGGNPPFKNKKKL